MRYREVIIDGRVFLEIVDDIEDMPPGRRENDEEDRRDEDDNGNGVWIGELVPYV